MKCCSKCHIEKPYSEFYKDKYSPSGYDYYCKSCKKPKVIQWQHNNKELVRKMTLKTHSSIPPGVYKITCLINNKCYIGQSTRPYKRILSEHLVIHKNFNEQLTSILLQNDLKKYGRNNFTFEILEHCEPELLIEREIHYIKIFNPEYNLNGK